MSLFFDDATPEALNEAETWLAEEIKKMGTDYIYDDQANTIDKFTSYMTVTRGSVTRIDIYLNNRVLDVDQIFGIPGIGHIKWAYKAEAFPDLETNIKDLDPVSFGFSEDAVINLWEEDDTPPLDSNSLRDDEIDSAPY